MIIIENGNYRLATISTLTANGIVDNPVRYGLGIERCCPGGELWYSVAFIKYDEHQKDCDIQSIGTRIFDIEPKEWSTFLRLGKAARELIKAVQND